MSDRGGIALGIATALPVGLCAVAAGGMLLAGDQRALALEIALPGAVLLGGALVSAVPATALVVRRLRARRTAHDATAQQQALDATAAAAAHHEREKHQQFLARLDHELKNPLTAIRATAVAAQVGNAGPSAPARPLVDDAWRTVDAQAQKLSTLVRDLRKLADLESRPLDREPVDLESLVAEAITAVEQQHPQTRGRITFAVTRVPWPVPLLNADVDLLSLAVDNVLGNAAKYSDAGPIEVRLREDNGGAVLEVADSGRGVPAADLPTVFDDLARAQNARDISGSGIGLTLVATVVRRHGGDVSIRSVEGAGTMVTIRLR